jgi:SP family arabinose:H+ symporter-like MFS transporter
MSEQKPFGSRDAGQRTTLYVSLVASVAAVGGLLFGYDLSIIGGAIIYLKNAFHLSDVQEGFAMASAVIGCMVGPLVASVLADRIGRKPTLLIAAALFGASSIGAALPDTIGQFNFFRAIGGIGVGLSSIVSPMYIAEISPARIRGRLVTVNQLGIVGGSFIAILVSYALARSGIKGEWRWMFASECVPVALLLVGLLFVPESPRWLAQRGRPEAASAVLTRIEGVDCAAAEMLAMATVSTEERGRFIELFRPGMRVALLIGVGLAVFQQITGASILFANAPIVFQKAGFSAAPDAIGQTVLLQIWNVVMTVLSMWLVDRVGRRLLLLWGVGAMGLGMVAMGLPLTWLIMSEIFPTRLRSKGMAVASVALWVAFFAGLQTFPILREYFIKHFGSIAGMIYLFAGVCGVALIFFLRFVPETRGKTLEDVSRLFEPATGD